MNKDESLKATNRLPFKRALRNCWCMAKPFIVIMIIFALWLMWHTRGIVITELRNEIEHSRQMQRLMATHNQVTMDKMYDDVKQLEWTDGNRSMNLIKTGLIEDGEL